MQYRMRHVLLIALSAVSGVVSGCSQNGGNGLLPQIGQKTPDTYKQGQPYELTAEEKSLDCKRLTGRMQIRILQTRDASVKVNSSALGRGMQSAVTPVLGGTTYGADPAADAARDRAVLEAMNKQLAAKKCPTYDLDAELRPRSIRDTPTPVPNAEAAAKSKTK